MEPAVPTTLKGYIPGAIVESSCMVKIVVEWLFAMGVTGLEEKWQVAPAGRPSQIKVTGFEFSAKGYILHSLILAR